MRRQIQAVFQDPYSSLNPSMTVEDIVTEPLRVHTTLTRAERRVRAVDLLRLVSLSEEHLRRRPHQFSGGQRQRIAIAAALALEPKLIVLDEPVSALDVSTQNQIINLLYERRDAQGIAYLLIAHDLALVHHISDRIAVMYLGHIVEEGPASRVYRSPAHPYSQALLDAVPLLDPAAQRARRARRRAAPAVETPRAAETGCPYRHRCPSAMPRCSAGMPPSYPGRGRRHGGLLPAGPRCRSPQTRGAMTARYRSDRTALPVGEARLQFDPAEGGPLSCRWPDRAVPVGVVIFCHGLGGSDAGYAGLSRHWARHGYLVIHPSFDDAIATVAQAEPELGLDPDSDLSGWATRPEIRDRMHQILHSPDRWLGRVATTRAVLHALPRIAGATCGPLPPETACAIAGHSFGAYTAQLLAGAEIDLPDAPSQRYTEPGFVAAMLLSAQGRDQQGLRDGSWDAMTGPVLTVTGTRDRGANGGDWRWKSEPFEFAPAGGKYLAVLDGGDHYLGGIAERPGVAAVPEQLAAMESLTLAFLDAHVRGSAAASAWLAEVGDHIADCALLYRRKDAS